MLKIVLAKEEALPELDQLSDDIFADGSLVGVEYYERLQKVVKIFVDKHWIQ